MTAKGAKRTAKSTKELVPPVGGVAIRMYRQGLGDCFLLAFDRDRNQPAHMLIDCGVHMSQEGGSRIVSAIVDDIIATTGGKVDIVAATHQHADHLSGFKQEAGAFLLERLKIEELWLAWTEDPNDKAAKQLRKGRTAARRAIEKALAELHKKSQADRATIAMAGRIDSFGSYFGFGEQVERQDAGLALDLGLRDADKVSGTELALELLKKCAPSGGIRYLRPGDGPNAILGSATARAYVLGPPLDEKLLKKSDPSAGKAKETYLSSMAGAISFSALAIEAGGDETEREKCFPFAPYLRHRQTGDWRMDCGGGFFDRVYGAADSSNPERWRCIDDDWLRGGETLALQLDKHTNNTSLVLALEIGKPGTGRVLFFAADAQVGSWLSWAELSWRAGKKTVTARDLLERTCVYKVGHHASHNATLRRDAAGEAYGLELMPTGCVALIPVDQKCAKKLAWGMPDPKLYKALHRITRGNILRSDNGHDDEVPKIPTRSTPVPGLSGAQWSASDTTKPDGSPLYYDIEIDDIEIASRE